MSQIKQQLKSLKREKGIASRAIGEAKKNDQDCSALIARVSGITEQIRSLEEQIKQPKKVEKTDVDFILPAQYQQEMLSESENDEDLTTQTDISSDEWDRYVTNHPQASLYHQAAFREVITDSFQHHCHYLGARNSKGELRGVLPLVEMKSRLFGHFLVSMPYFNYGGVLASSHTAKIQLLRSASALAGTLGCEHIEYRNVFPLLDLATRSTKVGMLRALPDSTEKLDQQLGSKLRAQIKKAERLGVTTRLGKSELLDDFYRVFSRNMRDLGTPVYSQQFFRNLFEKVPSAEVIVAYAERKPVSAGILMGWRNTMEIPWASTIRQANRLDANMKLYLDTLHHAIYRGYKVFDFGRSSKDAGTFRFKRQWGAKPQELHWSFWLPTGSELPEINPNNPKYRLFIRLWQHLPLPVAHLLGPPLVKNIP